MLACRCIFKLAAEMKSERVWSKGWGVLAENLEKGSFIYLLWQ